jgi:hypothetical protein
MSVMCCTSSSLRQLPVRQPQSVLVRWPLDQMTPSSALPIRICDKSDCHLVRARCGIEPRERQRPIPSLGMSDGHILSEVPR